MSGIATRIESAFEWLSAASRSVKAEVFAQIRAERSDFARFNHARLRQAGTVERQIIELRLVEGQRTVSAELGLTGRRDEDEPVLRAACGELAAALSESPEDPYLLLSAEPSQSSDIATAQQAAPDEVQRLVARSAAAHDLVGAYMAGPIAQGMWSSRGHRHLFERNVWSFDYSLYPDSRLDPALRNKAVKSTVAGTDWQASLVTASIEQAVRKLEVLRRPAIVLAPGDYATLLSPAAVADLVDMMCWGGFSLRSQSTGQSPLSGWRAGQGRMNTLVNLRDDLTDIAAPRFQADGYVRPARLDLIVDGQPGELYCSPRSSREFSAPANGASSDESPQTLSLAAGSLDPETALSRLGTGIDIGNLWYLNFSDRVAARVTGMTRFASLWVENGRWQAPIEPMRFDDSIIDLFGDRLVDLSTRPEWLPVLDSYDWRSSAGRRMPAALLSAMRFTL